MNSNIIIEEIKKQNSQFLTNPIDIDSVVDEIRKKYKLKKNMNKTLKKLFLSIRNMEKLTEKTSKIKKSDLPTNCSLFPCKESKIENVFIPTKDRPNSLKKSLESLVNNMISYGHDINIIVIDDSSCKETSLKNQEILKKLSKKHSLTSLKYFGKKDRKDVSEYLSKKTGIDSEICNFTFLGKNKIFPENKLMFSGGAARNFSLLLSQGTKFLTLDDDVELKFITNQKSFYINKSIEGPVYTKEWYPINEDLKKMTERYFQFDIFSNIGLSLGAKIFPLKIQNSSGQKKYISIVDNEDCSNEFGRISFVRFGTAGDPGTDTTAEAIFSSQSSIQELISKKNQYDLMMNRNYICSSALEYSVSQKLDVFTMLLGIDNSQELPPFSPTFRGEDFLFGKITESFKKCRHNILHFPFAVSHIPPEQRVLDRNLNLSKLLEYSPNVFLKDMFFNFIKTCSTENPREIVLNFGNYLIELSRQDKKKLTNTYLSNHKKNIAKMLISTEKKLNCREAFPEYFVKDLKLFKKIAIKKLKDGTFKSGNLGENFKYIKPWLYSNAEMYRNWFVLMDTYNKTLVDM